MHIFLFQKPLYIKAHGGYMHISVYTYINIRIYRYTRILIYAYTHILVMKNAENSYCISVSKAL